MPPKSKEIQRKVDCESSETSASEDHFSEEKAIREGFEEYKKALRIAKDLKGRDSPVTLMHFAKSAWQDGFSRSVDSIYMLYKRAIDNKAEDPIAVRGRPSKKPNALQLHTFASVSAANASKGKILLTPKSLAVFDKFCAAQKSDPREHTLTGTKLKEAVERLKRMEPWLTTTRAIATSADRMDGTSANIMEAYYTSIDELHERYDVLDFEPSRTLNFDECGLNNRGEYQVCTWAASRSCWLLSILFIDVFATCVVINLVIRKKLFKCLLQLTCSKNSRDAHHTAHWH
jgi:hypothetical protein